MVAEFYPGWLMHWAEPFPEVSDSIIARQTELYLKNNVSFNLYMVHGGTNFGFTSGANYDKKRDIQPDLTSYDYGTLITEAGWTTAKFDSVRNVIKKYVDNPLPTPPTPLPVIEIPGIKITTVAPLLEVADNLPGVESSNPLTMEQLGQGYGYVLYTRHFNQPISGTLSIPGLRDYATVYVNGEKVGVLNRNTRTYDLDVEIPFNATLQILVENMGRINYGSEIVHNNKGIISPVTLNDMPVTGGWTMHSLPMSKVPAAGIDGIGKAIAAKNASQLARQPVIARGVFTLDKVGDTFLDMTQWGKGIVFVNGHNLGRYWSVGPQQTLFLPGAWLNKGENEIVIFEQLNDSTPLEVNGLSTPILKTLRR